MTDEEYNEFWRTRLKAWHQEDMFYPQYSETALRRPLHLHKIR